MTPSEKCDPRPSAAGPGLGSGAALSDATVLVTGGSSGIGRAITSGLLREGARVGVVSRRSPSTWEIPPSCHEARLDWIEADLRGTKESCHAARQWLSAVRREVDIVVYSAVTYGSTSRHALSATTMQEWNDLMNVNVRSAFMLTRLLLPSLLARPRALILGLTSDVVFGDTVGRLGYAASKAAAHTLLRGVAAEYSSTSLSVVQLLPTRQVETPGIRRRRPAGFDFSAYAQPEEFIEPSLAVALTRGAGQSGGLLRIP